MKTAYALARTYPVAVAAIFALTVLLSITLFRLAQVQQDLRENVGTNMYWVVSQAQIESLRLSNALMRKRLDSADTTDTHLQYQLLLSRLNILKDGPQARYLEAQGLANTLHTHFVDIESLAPLFKSDTPITAAEAARTHDILQRFTSTMAEAGADAMAQQWYDSGERLDQYRNTVLTTLILMVGILLSSTIIAVNLMLTLKRARDGEQSRLLAAQLERQLDAERKLSELYRDFSAMVSHQFRTPLAIIDSNMQRMIRASDRLTGIEVARRAIKVRESIQRLTALMESTLSADRFINATSVSLQIHDLHQIVEEAINLQLSATPNRHIELLDELNQPTTAFCDPVLTGQILLNLTSNADKYSPADQPIKLRLYGSEEAVYCSVTDFGPGIAGEDLPWIFDRYYRAKSSATIVGTGIGLHVARQLARLQHSELTVQSVSGQGSTFVLKLLRSMPVADASSTQSENLALSI